MLDYRTCMLPWDILLRLRAARQKYSSIQGVTVLRKKWLKGSLLDYKRAQQQLREAYTTRLSAFVPGMPATGPPLIIAFSIWQLSSPRLILK